MTRTKLLRQGMVDGPIALSTKPALHPICRELREAGTAVMLRLPHLPGFEECAVRVHIDIAEGFRRLAEHLIDGGCRRIGVLGGRVAMELADGAEHRAAVPDAVSTRGHLVARATTAAYPPRCLEPPLPEPPDVARVTIHPDPVRQAVCRGCGTAPGSVFAGFAARGRSTMNWFTSGGGFKLHLIIDERPRDWASG